MAKPTPLRNVEPKGRVLSPAEHPTHQGWADGDPLRSTTATRPPVDPRPIEETDSDRALDALSTNQVIPNGADVARTRERVRQIESKTLAKLRRPDAAHLLRDYLEES